MSDSTGRWVTDAGDYRVHRELRALREHSYAEPRHALVRLRDER